MDHDFDTTLGVVALGCTNELSQRAKKEAFSRPYVYATIGANTYPYK